MNTLGLGRNSTLLNALVDNGTIGGRTWGFWQGWTGAEPQHQMDGNLVLGGYDAAKITGPNIALPTSSPDDFDTDCFLATITDIRMNLKNGSSPSLFGSSKATAARACVEPHFELLSLSQDLWEAFLSISGSTYVTRSTSVIAFYGMLIEANGAYDGDLTISIDPGLDITIPNHQLVVPDYHIDSDGQTYVSNDNQREVLIGSLDEINSNDGLVLGSPFFTSAYMMVDNDREQFTLWSAHPTTSSQLVASPASDCENGTDGAPLPPLSTATTPPAYNNGYRDGYYTNNQASISKGAIAGAVVGGLAGITLLFILFFVMKRRRTKARTKENASAGARSNSLMFHKPELASDQQPPQELPLVQDTSSRSAPYEMSEDEAHQELSNEEGAFSRYELPAATPGQSSFELSGLPSSPRPKRKNLPTRTT